MITYQNLGEGRQCTNGWDNGLFHHPVTEKCERNTDNSLVKYDVSEGLHFQIINGEFI